MNVIEEKKLLLLENGKQYFEDHGKFPTNEIVEKKFGVPRRTLRRYFGSLTGYIEELMKHVDEPLFTEERANSAKRAVKKNKRFVITTAVVGAEVDENAYKALKQFCKKQNAQLLIMPSADPAASVSDGLDELIKDEIIAFQPLMLNSNIGLSDIKTSAKQINPATGLARIGQRNKTTIFASPKQNLEYVAVGNNKHPHALMTTGAITKPAYQTNKYMSLRTAYIANHDHIMGAVIVDIKDDKYFDFTQVQFNEDGSFTHLGNKYHANGKVEKNQVEHMVLGDLHSGAYDSVVFSKTIEMIKTFKPKSLILHDILNGDSINHHEREKVISWAKKKKRTLKSEFIQLREDLISLQNAANSSVFVVKSNHDIWVDRFLNDRNFVNDHVNLRELLELAIAKYDGQDVISYGVSSLLNQEALSSITFLKRDQDLILNGYQCGSHSDIEGSLVRFEKSFGKCIGGHSHTPGILRQARRVGTMTPLREHYAQGPINWVNAHALINKDGSVQIINIIK